MISRLIHRSDPSPASFVPRSRSARSARPARRAWPAVFGLAVLLTAAVHMVTADRPQARAAVAPSGDRTVIVQLFQWGWSDVARECTEVLGPKGYGAVQISPPQEHVVLPNAGQGGHPWWQDYQPVSYRLTTRRGTEQDLKNMIGTCHAAGVKVYADALVNHMTGQTGGGTGSAGSTFPDKYTYPGLYSGADFHDCRRDISDYTNRSDVQNCELVGLADLKTESSYVRDTLAGYLNALLALGVDGFRVDGAKHVPAADLAAIKGRLSRDAYIYQEVVPGAGEPITPGEYLGNGDILEFRAGRKLAEMFFNDNNGRIKYLLDDFGPSWGFEASDRSVVFVDNHDTQRNALSGDRTLTYKDGALYRLATVFELAWNYGTPKIMSSFGFTARDTSPPADGDGATKTVTCDGSTWICEHRWREMANMVGFRNTVGSAPETHEWVGTDNQIAFGRGDKGFVVINRDGAALSHTFQTGLPAGTYCDVLHGELDTTTGTCTGPAVTVDASGGLTATVASMDALAVHAGARVS